MGGAISRPHSDYACIMRPIKRGEHSAGQSKKAPTGTPGPINAAPNHL
jgi:hypothetical protein